MKFNYRLTSGSFLIFSILDLKWFLFLLKGNKFCQSNKNHFFVLLVRLLANSPRSSEDTVNMCSVEHWQFIHCHCINIFCWFVYNFVRFNKTNCYEILYFLTSLLFATRYFNSQKCWAFTLITEKTSKALRASLVINY